jgi:hypothetical protein
MFYALWGIANGPMAVGSVALKNALVLHDLEEMQSLFLHLNPPLICWSFRWHSDKIGNIWPGLFAIPS